MQMGHKKRKKHDATLTCDALEIDTFIINMLEYDFGYQ